MSEEAVKVVCDLNMRPRIDGVPTLVEAGTPFDASLIDSETEKILREQGHLKDVPPAKPQAPPTEKEGEKPQADTYSEPPKEGKAKGKGKAGKKASTPEKKATPGAKDAPKGMFAENVEDLKEFSTDELDTLHAELCQKYELPAPEPFASVEEGIAKLSGKTAEEVLEILTGGKE